MKLLLIIIFTSHYLLCQKYQGGRSNAVLLNNFSDPINLALNSSNDAMKQGLYGVYTNPASIRLKSTFNLNLSTMSYFADINTSNLIFAYKYNEHLNFTYALNFTFLGETKVTTAYDTEGTGKTLSSYIMTNVISSNFTVYNNLKVGVNLKLYQENYEVAESNSFLSDIGFQYTYNDQYSISFVYKNLYGTNNYNLNRENVAKHYGVNADSYTNFSSEQIKPEWHFAIAYSTKLDDNTVNVFSKYWYDSGQNKILILGTELNYQEQFFLRYSYQMHRNDAAYITSPSAYGFGINFLIEDYGNVQVNYAYKSTEIGALGNIHSFGINMEF